MRVDDIDVEYKGGLRDIMYIEHGMQYEEFIATTCQTLNILAKPKKNRIFLKNGKTVNC